MQIFGSDRVELGVVVASIMAMGTGLGQLVVTNDADAGAGSLREAIANATIGDSITFDAGLSGGTIVLSTGSLSIDKNLTIDGSALAAAVTIDANGESRIFHVTNGTVTFNHLIITRGKTSGSGISSRGGGILKDAGDLFLINCQLTENQSTSGGGGVFSGTGALTITRTSFYGNDAAFDGGAVHANGGTLTITNSSFARNVAGGHGGAVNFGASGSATQVTLTENLADTGGGLSVRGTSVTLSNALITGNRALAGPDVAGVLDGASSGNLIGDGTDVSGILDGSNGNQLGTAIAPINARLAPMSDYGGLTRTIALLAGSPAIDGGVASGEATDQRGLARVGATDIGAYEAGPVMMVTNTQDSGGGSLREILSNITTEGTRVLFDLPSGDDRIVLTSGQLNLAGDQNIFIDASARPITIDGNDSSRVLFVPGGGILALHAVTITGGNVPSGNGGGILNIGSLTGISCRILSNFVGGRGGGISSIFDTSEVYLFDSIVWGNDANDLAGGIELFGAARIVNSTIAGNSSGSGGGYFCFPGDVTIESSTIAENQASVGGGLTIQGATVSLRNTIVAANVATSGGPDILLAGGDLFSRGGNMIGDHSTVTSVFPAGMPNGNADVVGSTAAPIVPWLGPLSDNGGLTETMALLENSPAIDIGVSGAGVGFQDQRGYPRGLAGGYDSGAYETSLTDLSPETLKLHGIAPAAIAGDSTLRFEISEDPSFPGVITTIAGTGSAGFVDGSASESQFYTPSSVAEDSFGNLFIADTANNRIRMMAPDGTVSTIAGTGAFGFINGDGDQATFAFPVGVAVGPNQHVYVADTFNHAIRKLRRPDGEGLPWQVTTLAGAGTPGTSDGSGTSAFFNRPNGLTYDPVSNCLQVADTLNDLIRSVSLLGSVSTKAGGGGAFTSPYDVAVSGSEVYVTDGANHRIRKIAADGTVTTIAGSNLGFANGIGSVAEFHTPVGITIGNAGNLIVSEHGNHTLRALDRMSPWTVTSLGLTSPTSNHFNCPTGVLQRPSGDIIVVDKLNHRIRQLSTDPLSVSASAGANASLGQTFSAMIDAPALGLVPGKIYYYRWATDSLPNGGGFNGGDLGTFFLTALTPFELWQLAEFGEDAGNPLIAGPFANPDDDAFFNLIEYAFHLDPNSFSFGPAFELDEDGGTVTFVYPRVLSATDITYQVEWSTDLITWHTTGITEEVLPGGDGVVEEILASLPNPGVRLFIQVRILQNLAS